MRLAGSDREQEQIKSFHPLRERVTFVSAKVTKTVSA